MAQISSSERAFEIIRNLWPGLPEGEFVSMERQYSQLLRQIGSELDGISENKDLFALTSRHEVLASFQVLRGLGSVGKREATDAILRIASPRKPSEDQVVRSLDVAVRIWLTMSITSTGLRRHGWLVWTSERYLEEIVESRFCDMEKSQSMLGPGERVQPELTAAYLVANYGFTLAWTYNLLEHLDIDWKYKVITIYEHKIVLQNGLRFPGSVPIPDSVLGEAIDTLNLLFPFQDDSTKKFLAKHKKPFYGLGFCNRPRKLELDKYQYWRSQVADLQLILNSPPIGLQQLRLDMSGSNLLQIATFWIATAVGVLTLTSIGIGVAAIVYGAKQYDISALQYELSVAQACLDPAVKSVLPKFCS